MADWADRYRSARLCLVTPDGEILGTTPPIRLDLPWLQEVRDLRAQAFNTWQIDVAILRLLAVDDSDREEIGVIYLAELAQMPPALPPLEPCPVAITTSAHRMPYAEPGGPASDLAWAADVITGAGFGEIRTKIQHRTWNLSSIWQLETDGNNGSAVFWLKHVPPFFSHEPDAIKLLEGERVPRLLAADGNRMLLYHVPGIDTYHATLTQKLSMVEQLVDLQYRWHDRLEELHEAGVPDLSTEKLLPFIVDAMNRHLAQFSHGDQALLRAFADSLPDRLQRLDACGLPVTLVHGDYHPGNWRGAGNNLTILDWGDCTTGHPLFDVAALTERTSAEDQPALLAHWTACWRSRLADADVEQALALYQPVAAARLAATYQMFLDHIEASEHIYHETDPHLWIQKAVEILRREKGT